MGWPNSRLAVTAHAARSGRIDVLRRSSDAVVTAHDLFISHASEDKESVATPLAQLLTQAGFRVWIDDGELTIGDSLRRAIHAGLSQGRFGVVVLSRSFFQKEWPQRELDGLLAREDGQSKLILPILHGLAPHEVARYSPILGARLAISTSKGLSVVARAIRMAIRREDQRQGVIRDNLSMPEVPMSDFDYQEPEQVRRWGGIKETQFPFSRGRCVLESAIRLDDAEAARNLLEAAVAKLDSTSYPPSVRDSFRIVFLELTRNAFGTRL